MIDFHAAEEAMFACAIWTALDPESGDSVKGYGIDDIHPEVAAQMSADLADFIDGAIADLEASGLYAVQVGHDFHLTRNHHGAGFWDRGLGRIGERLTVAAEAFGEAELMPDGAGHLA